MIGIWRLLFKSVDVWEGRGDSWVLGVMRRIDMMR
jgi:hypothetical protein